jgi:hypothetical protein
MVVFMAQVIPFVWYCSNHFCPNKCTHSRCRAPRELVSVNGKVGQGSTPIRLAYRVAGSGPLGQGAPVVR